MGMVLRFTAEIADEGHRIGRIPAAALGDAAKALGRVQGAAPEDERRVVDRDVEPVTRPDPEPPPGLARHDDLVLGADLDA
jgi:hypothetical protein